MFSSPWSRSSLRAWSRWSCASSSTFPSTSRTFLRCRCCSGWVLRSRSTTSYDVVDLERNTHPEQQRQRKNVREVEGKVEDDAQLQRDHARNEERDQGEENIAYPAQSDPQQQEHRREGKDAGLDE